MATAPAAQGSCSAPAPQAQESRAEPARGAEGAGSIGSGTGTRSLTALGGEALSLVMEVYGWLSLATWGTTRALRNRPFDAVLLWNDGGNQEVPPGGWVPREDHEKILRAVIRAGWPDQEPTWPAFLEGGTVHRVTDLDANNWLSQALRTALTYWPPPQAPTQAAAHVTATPGGYGPTPSKRGPVPHAAGTGGWERTSGAGHPPGRPEPPTRCAPPTPPLFARQGDTRRPR